MRSQQSPSRVTDLRVGDHVCHIYETEEERHACVIPFLLQGIERQEKVLHIGSAATTRALLSASRGMGRDLEPYREKGQLVLLTPEESYVRGGRFDPDELIARWRAEAQQAAGEGYRGLRGVGATSWALQQSDWLDRLVGYEAKLGALFAEKQVAAICPYDKRKFPPEVLFDILHVHPMVAVGPHICRNPHFVPPGEFLKDNMRRALLESHLAHLRDASGGKTAQAELGRVDEAVQQRLLQAQKMESIGTLAAGVAHNFNNILSIILGNAELAELCVGRSHPAAEFLTKIIKATDRAAGLARRLLSVTRREGAGGEVVSASALARSISEAMQMSPGGNVQISLRIAPDLPDVAVNQAEVEEALLNICMNARDAMPDGGTITVEAGVVELAAERCKGHPGMNPGRYVCFSIRDTGTGMDRDVLARIFDPFFTTKGPDKGIGLGLPAAYAIVVGHGGCIEVESEPGRGSCFRVYLPVASAKKPVAPRPKGPELQRGEERILVVDDEEGFRQVAEEGLRSLGYTTLSAGGGREAIDLYRREWERIDLVILDYVMSDLGGSETCLALRAINPNVKVILATGCDADGKSKVLADIAAHGFVGKPYSLSELSVAIRNVLDVGGGRARRRC